MYYLNKTNIIDHCVSDVIAWTDHPLDYWLVFWFPLQQKYVIRKPCPNSDQKVIAVRIWNPDMSGWLAYGPDFMDLEAGPFVYRD